MPIGLEGRMINFVLLMCAFAERYVLLGRPLGYLNIFLTGFIRTLYMLMFSTGSKGQPQLGPEGSSCTAEISQGRGTAACSLHLAGVC